MATAAAATSWTVSAPRAAVPKLSRTCAGVQRQRRLKKWKNSSVKCELSTPLVISLSTGASLFLGRFVFLGFQRENVSKQGLPTQNGLTHFEAGDTRAKEYSSLLKSNDPAGFNIVDVLAWGSIGHIVGYFVLATGSNNYAPDFFQQ